MRSASFLAFINKSWGDVLYYYAGSSTPIPHEPCPAEKMGPNQPDGALAFHTGTGDLLQMGQARPGLETQAGNVNHHPWNNK